MSDDPTEGEREAMLRRIAYSVSRAIKIVGPPEDALAEADAVGVAEGGD